LPTVSLGRFAHTIASTTNGHTSFTQTADAPGTVRDIGRAVDDSARDER